MSAPVAAQEKASKAPRMGMIQGLVLGDGSQDPLVGALIYVHGLPTTAVSDSTGAYRLPAPQGAWVVSVYHPRARELGLETAPSSLITVVAGEVVEADFRVVAVPQGSVANPFETEGIEVRVAPKAVPSRAREGARIDVMTLDEIEKRAVSARHIGDLIRAKFPSLRVWEPSAGELCVETRRVTTQGLRRGTGCTGMVAVIMDDVFIPDASLILPTIPPRDIERIEFMNALLGAARFGTRAGSGVLAIYTRTPRR